jgi:hypothetical protein
MDSPLEREGFEPSVSRKRMTTFRDPVRPLRQRDYCDPDFFVKGAELVDRHPSSFQIGEHSMRPQGINVSSRDRDFRPTRRRGFDDDNFETARRRLRIYTGIWRPEV